MIDPKWRSMASKIAKILGATLVKGVQGAEPALFIEWNGSIYGGSRGDSLTGEVWGDGWEDLKAPWDPQKIADIIREQYALRTP